jgi:uncharacterized repeat protein (TIGR03806 family)
MHSGDILVLDTGGHIDKLIPNLKSEISNSKFPTRLSETGLFLSTKDNTPDPALIPYDVNSPLWSDGAAKERFIALPTDGVMEMTPTRGWDCPEGTVLVKTFSLETKRIETRLITRQLGQWIGYTYRWNDDQTDATLVAAAGEDATYAVNGTPQTWHFPSRAECMTCHTRASNFVLGLSTPQLNRDHRYATGVTDNQIRVLRHLGAVKPKAGSEAALDGPEELLPKLPDPADASVDLDLRARSYLHANCAICHVKEGGGNALIDLEYTTASDKARVFGAAPQHETFALKDAKLIAPARPDASVLLHRIQTRGRGQMPPLATSRVDEAAAAMIRDWIAAIPPASN